MTRWLRFVVLLALVGVLTTASPAQAAVGVLNARGGAYAVLKADEFDKMSELQSIRPPVPAGPLSPDETTLMMTHGTRAFFINVQDGSQQPIDIGSLGRTSRLTNSSWLDNDHIGFLALDFTSRSPVMVVINRTSGRGSLRRVSLPAVPLPNVPALSPDGRKVLVATVRQDVSRKGLLFNEFVSPFNETINLGYGAGPTLDVNEPQLQIAATTVTLHVLDLATGDAVRVVALPGSSALTAMAWSADSRRLALSHFSFQTDETIQSPVKFITNLEAQGSIAPEKNPVLQTSVIDLVDVENRQVRVAALKAIDIGGGVVGDVELSPDGSVMMVVMQEPTKLRGREHPTYLFPQRQSLRFYSFDGARLGEANNALFETPEAPAVMVSNDVVVLNPVIGPDRGLVTYNRSTNEARRLPVPDGFVGALRVGRSTDNLMFVHMSFLQVPELFRLKLDGSALAALTYVNAEKAKLNQVRVDAVSFRLASGQNRNGYLIQPAGAAFPPQNVPIVVWQEGGPFAPMLNFFATNTENPFNLLPNFGVAVLFMPLDGRYGYGAERFRALYDSDNFGQIDIDEQAEIVKQMVRRGWTSSSRVGVSGCSYGGYFAAQSIARHPGTYAAANPQCTLLDLFDEWNNGTRTAAVAFMMGGAPTGLGHRYADASPLYGAARVKAATLLFHGTDDFLPVMSVVALHDQVQRNGAATNMYAFAGEGHGLAQSGSQLVAAQYQLQWFREFLK